MKSSHLPRLLRAFSILFIAVPGIILWILGAMSAVRTAASLFHPERILYLRPLLWSAAFGIVTMVIGFLMLIGSRILCSDPREAHVGSHLPERLGWSLAVQFSGVLVAGAGLAIALIAFRGTRENIASPLVATVIASFAWYYCDRHRSKLHQSWWQELLEQEAEIRATRAPSSGIYHYPSPNQPE